MMSVSTKILAGAAGLAALAVTTAASAATIVPIGVGPFSLADPNGVIPVCGPPLTCAPAGPTNWTDTIQPSTTYDFTFTTLAGLYTADLQMQQSDRKTGAAQTLTWSLFKGDPGSGTFLTSATTGSASTLQWPVGNASASQDYYMEIVEPNVLGSKGSFITGGFTLFNAVPEPATWAMMIMGIGLLGVAGRRRRSLAAAAA